MLEQGLQRLHRSLRDGRAEIMNRNVHAMEVGRLPSVGDNVAIAVRRLDAGTTINFPNGTVPLPHTVLEGHRFAFRVVPKGAWLTSWGLPFGRAVRELKPGDYVCNQSILKALAGRRPDFKLPSEPNFEDARVQFELGESSTICGRQVEMVSNPGTFLGYFRGGRRGAGTRNFIAVLAVSSRASSFARELARRFSTGIAGLLDLDGVIALTHTEGGGSGRPHNLDLSVTTLSGMVGHPNLGAVLAVDQGNESLNNEVLREALRRRWPGEKLPALAFLSLKDGWNKSLQAGTQLIQGWINWVQGLRREAVPLAHLRIGLQCGGSDAFSGVSGNPLVGWVAKELIRHGGSANLAETSELIGAEPYVLSNVRDEAVARKFLATQSRFQEWAGWHGHSAEGNPSGGNMYRGLYNIAIKSIGAARKKDPEVRLDEVIDYGEAMGTPGYYFMDSPGNDLESIAGQVAAGCNLIHFATGNGSITNFPFVPTIKVMTNTGRFRMLSREMDFNAGRYLDGESMDDLGREAFALTVRVASGERSAGEKAGHSQLQLWREWRQTSPARLGLAELAPSVDSPACVARSPLPGLVRSWVEQAKNTDALAGVRRKRSSVGLVLPTSLCAAQVALMVAERLGEMDLSAQGLSNFAALPHTEGCGNSGGDSEEILMRIMTGHLRHPRVGAGLLMEHGCEKTHHDAFRNWIEREGGDLRRYGWTSIQLDGGIDATVGKSLEWFRGQTSMVHDPAELNARIPALGLAWTSALSEGAMWQAQCLARAWNELGGAVVVASGGAVSARHWLETWVENAEHLPDFTLRCGEAYRPGVLQWMDTPTDDLVEAWSALAATGVEVMSVWDRVDVRDRHPFVPMMILDSAESSEDAARICEVLDTLVEIAARGPNPEGHNAFQVTRGRFGVSL